MTEATGSSCAAANGSAADRPVRRRNAERVLLGLCLGLAVCCSNSDFTARPGNPDAGAGNGGTAGAAGSAGSAGRDAGGGRAGSGGRDGGADGSAGQPSCPAACPTGEYCNSGSNRCVPCSDVSRFQFASPEPIAPSPTSVRRFPRATDVEGALFFRQGEELTVQNIFFTPSFADGGAPELFDADVNVADRAASGPLLVVPNDASLPNFYFDRTSAAPGTPRQLYQGTRLARGAVENVKLMPVPFNRPPAETGEDHSIAVASAAGRAWWMSRSERHGNALLTAPLGASTVEEANEVALSLGQGTCQRQGLDSAPWASTDGAFLLFASLELSSSCIPLAGARRDLYIGVMQQDGQPAAFARLLDDVSLPGRDETDPSMSRDLCSLYFAASESTSPGAFRLYAARRR